MDLPEISRDRDVAANKHKPTRTTLALLVTLCFMPLAQATEYYVARTGNDTKNNGESADTPFATMDKALKVIQPGDALTSSPPLANARRP